MLHFRALLEKLLKRHLSVLDEPHGLLWREKCHVGQADAATVSVVHKSAHLQKDIIIVITLNSSKYVGVLMGKESSGVTVTTNWQM